MPTPSMQRELRHITMAIACRAVLLGALTTAHAVAQSTTVLAAAPQSEAESRAAVLHALFVLRIAPYLTVEGGADARKPDDEGATGAAAEPKGTPPQPPVRPPAGQGTPPGDGRPPAGETKPPAAKPKPVPDVPPSPTPKPGAEAKPPAPRADRDTPPPPPEQKPPAETDKPAGTRPQGAGKPADEGSSGDKAAGKARPGAVKARPYRIGLVGHDDIVGVAPRHLNGKKVGDREATTVVVTLEHAIDATSAGDYDLLYVADSVEPKDLQKILASHARLPKPIVGARPGFAAAGGGVQLFVQDNAVRFEVNADVLRRQGVHVDSQLQKLSKRGPR